MILDFPGIEGNIDIYMKVLRAICGDTAGKSMIDLCCAFAPNTPMLGFERRIYIDVIDRKLDHPQEQPLFVKADVLTFKWWQKFDVAICSDGIEHFYPADGRKLLDIMKRIGHKQIIFTPIGEIFKLHNGGEHDPESHHSLWTPEDFPGWATIVFPDYHKVWNGGAFFAVNCDNIDVEFERIKSEIML